MHEKTPLEIHFKCVGIKEIYHIFMTCYVVSVLFSTKCHLFNNFIFFCSPNTFFINSALKFEYKPSLLKVH